MILTVQQLLDGNEIVALFIGWKYNPPNKSKQANGGTWSDPSRAKHDVIGKLSFHKNFNELIPVCKKCRSIVQSVGYDKESGLMEKWNNIDLSLGSMDAELIFSKTVEFIKLYNIKYPMENQQNYMHVCEQIHCTKCNYIDADCSFKVEHKTIEEGEGHMATSMDMICPKCGSKDTNFVENGKPTHSVMQTTWASGTTEI